MERESFKSRLGFLLVSAGCAIGIGNVWRFPFVVGQNGGGFFVLVYLVMLVVLGLPVLTMELAVGRASRKSAVLAYKALEKPGSKWHIHGWFAIIGCCLLMMYYTTVSGWMLDYFFKFVTGVFTPGMAAEVSGQVFSDMLASPTEMGLWMVITVAAGVLVCSIGVQKGLERVSKVMMTALLVLILVLAIHSFTLPGAKEGIAFYLVPNMDNVRSVGLGNVIAAAMNQAFFTLSLGIAAMEIFGSYMSKDHTLLSEGARICGLDTFVAVMAVIENIMSSCMDLFGWSRKKAALINGVIILIASVPCVLGYNVLSDFHPIGGRDVLDSEDFLVSSILLPLGSLIYLLFCVTRWGWGFKNYQAEANAGKGMKVAGWMRWLFMIVLPLMILAIFIIGLTG